MGANHSMMEVQYPSHLCTDKPVSTLGARESMRVHNVITRNLPHRLSVRNGIPVHAAWSTANGYTSNVSMNDGSTTYDGVFPYCAFPTANTDYMYVYYANHKAGAFFVDYMPFYGPGKQYLIGNGGNPRPPEEFGHVVVDLNQSDVFHGDCWDETGVFHSAQPWGHHAYFDGLTFIQDAANCYTFANLSPLYAITKYYDTTGTLNAFTPFAMFSDNVYTQMSQPMVVGNAVETWTSARAASTGGRRNVPSVAWTASVNNASTTVTRTAGDTLSNSYTGFICQITDSAANPAYRFLHQVKSHAAASSTIILDRPWGLGEPTATVPDAVTDPMVLTSKARVNTAPLSGVTMATFRERLFSARVFVTQTATSGGPQNLPTPVGEYGGFYANGIAWSKPGNWNRWPDQNFAILDSNVNTPITAMVGLSEKLVIFRENSMTVMTGYDEDSFVFETVSDTVGCPYPNGLTTADNILYFANPEGVWAYDGEQLVNMMKPINGLGGVQKGWKTRVEHCCPGGQTDTLGEPLPKYAYFWPTLAVTPSKHLVVVLQKVYDYERGASPSADNRLLNNWVCDLETGSWSTWGYNPGVGWAYNESQYNTLRVVQAPDGRVFGIHRDFMTELTNVWDPDAPSYDYQDDIPTNGSPSGTNTQQGYEAYVHVNLTPYPGYITHVKEGFVEHQNNYWWSGGNNTPQYTWDVSPSGGVFLNYAVQTQSMKLQARYMGPFSSALPGVDTIEPTYMEPFTRKFQIDGEHLGFLFKMDTDAYDDFIYPYMGPFGLDLFGSFRLQVTKGAMNRGGNDMTITEYV